MPRPLEIETFCIPVDISGTSLDTPLKLELYCLFGITLTVEVILSDCSGRWRGVIEIWNFGQRWSDMTYLLIERSPVFYK